MSFPTDDAVLKSIYLALNEANLCLFLKKAQITKSKP